LATSGEVGLDTGVDPTTLDGSLAVEIRDASRADAPRSNDPCRVK